jgi:hypothetical protein
LVGTLLGNCPSEDREDMDVILRRLLRKYVVRWCGELKWLRIVSSGGICEHYNIASGSIKVGKFSIIWATISLSRKSITLSNV